MRPPPSATSTIFRRCVGCVTCHIVSHVTLRPLMLLKNLKKVKKSLKNPRSYQQSGFKYFGQFSAFRSLQDSTPKMTVEDTTKAIGRHHWPPWHVCVTDQIQPPLSFLKHYKPDSGWFPCRLFFSQILCCFCDIFLNLSSCVSAG